MKQVHPRAVWLFFVSYCSYPLILPAFILYLAVFGKRPFPPRGRRLISWSEFIESYAHLWWVLVLVVVALVLIAYIFARLRWRNYRYELGEHAYEQVDGVILREKLSIPYNRIQSVTVKQGPLARVLGLANIYITTAGVIERGKNKATSVMAFIRGITEQEAYVLKEELLEKARKAGASLFDV